MSTFSQEDVVKLIKKLIKLTRNNKISWKWDTASLSPPAERCKGSITMYKGERIGIRRLFWSCFLTIGGEEVFDESAELHKKEGTKRLLKELYNLAKLDYQNKTVLSEKKRLKDKGKRLVKLAN